MFLWIGAPNPRKGYPLMLEAIKLAEHIPEWEIYIKTTMPKVSWFDVPRIFFKNWRKILRRGQSDEREKLLDMLQRLPKPYYRDRLMRLGKHKNIVFDTRVLPFEELRQLYNTANCFILPTLGEGWGLTLCEAMATGCPCIATNVTGVSDFFNDDVGYSIKHYIKEFPMRDFKLLARGYVPDAKDMIEKMIHVYKYYREALKKGKKASDRIHSKFTWEKSGERLKDILVKFDNWRKSDGNYNEGNS